MQARAEGENINSLKRKVADIMVSESADGPWSARDGMCLDLAAKWHERLKKDGIETQIAAVDPNLEGQTLSVGGKRVHGKFHAFLVSGEGDNQVIIDGSVQQFFDGPEKRDDVPKVFVGTASQLKDLFARHPKDLRLEVAGDPHVGRYNASDLADFAYGMGRFGHSRELLN